MQAALAQVREELGPDAVILSTRSARRDRGLRGLLAKPRVEVTAAIDRERELAPRGAGGRRVGADDSWRTLQLNRALVAPLEEELRELRAAIEGAQRSQAPQPTLASEVAELRRVARAMAARVAESEVDGPTTGFRAAGLSAGHARELGASASERIERGCPEAQAMVDVLAERLEHTLGPPRVDAGHQLVVGPPGVGKTTTVAKEAGANADGKMRIVSTDAHRHGASEGLRSIARCLGIRFDEVGSHDELARLARSPRTQVLVDTPGACRNDGRALSDLALFRRALGARAQVQLVLSATTKECDLRLQLACYRDLEPQALVFTKLDESAELGNLVNVLLDGVAPPLAWIAGGQHIPEDLEVPDPHGLARRVMAVSP